MCSLYNNSRSSVKKLSKFRIGAVFGGGKGRGMRGTPHTLVWSGFFPRTLDT